MEINYLMIIGAGIVAMIVGSVWYGPLFGKKWMEVIHATEMDVAKRKEMQKKAMPLYGIQFVFVLVQVFVLTNLVIWTGGNGMGVAFWMWLGFVLPTVAGSAMWNNEPNRVKWAMFLIQSGYYLVLFLIFGFIIEKWG